MLGGYGDGDDDELPWLLPLQYWPKEGSGAALPAMVAAICAAAATLHASSCQGRAAFLSLVIFS